MNLPFVGRRRRTRGARAVVTGAGSGIGRAIAIELAERGSDVVCADIALDRAEETADLVEERGATGHAVLCDVADRAQIAALAEASPELLRGPTTLLVNNAGVGVGGERVGEIGAETWDWTLGINLWGVVNGCEIFMPQLREAGFGGIINTASAAGFATLPLMGPYNVSKAGVIALSETISAELSGTDINVTVLCPTGTRTNIVANGRITGPSEGRAERAMNLFGSSAERVARCALDSLDKGNLYALPQPDARLVWSLKRLGPGQYTSGLGTVYRAYGLLDRDRD